MQGVREAVYQESHFFSAESPEIVSPGPPLDIVMRAYRASESGERPKSASGKPAVPAGESRGIVFKVGLLPGSRDRHIEISVAIQTVRLGCCVCMMADGAWDFVEVRSVGIALWEVLRRALAGELLLGTMANQAAAILDGGAQQRHFFAMASGTVNHSLGV